MSEAKTIAFTRASGEILALHSGDMLRIGGVTVDNLDPQDEGRELIWLAQPDDECPSDVIFVDNVVAE